MSSVMQQASCGGYPQRQFGTAKSVERLDFEMFFEVARDNHGNIVKAGDLLYTSFSPRGKKMDLDAWRRAAMRAERSLWNADDGATREQRTFRFGTRRRARRCATRGKTWNRFSSR